MIVRLGQIVEKEPVLFAGLIQAAVAALIAFGVHLTVDQASAVMGVEAAVLAFLVRGTVTPT